MPNVVFLGAINLLIAVILGAFGAHGLKSRLSAEQMGWWQTGTSYHIYHGLGLLLIGVLLAQRSPVWAAARQPALCLQLGIVIFCGTLYAMALGGPRWLGAITPLGGTAFIVGWGWLALLALRAGGDA